MINWIVLFLITFLHVIFGIRGRKNRNKIIENKINFYFKTILFDVLILGIFFVIEPSLFYHFELNNFDKGFEINEDIIVSIITIFPLPLVFSSVNLIKDNSEFTKELFGFPIGYVPNKYIEYLVFILFIITGVIFEELLSRQFLFYSLFKTLHINGDLVILISAILFSFGHIYQGWKGVISGMIVGLILGKIFLLKGNIVYPITLHLLLNMTILVLAGKRIKKLQKSK